MTIIISGSGEHIVQVCKSYFTSLFLLLFIRLRLCLLKLLEHLHKVTPIICHTCSHFVAQSISGKDVLQLCCNYIVCVSAPESYTSYCCFPSY